MAADPQGEPAHGAPQRPAAPSSVPAELLNAARQVFANAYAPFSGFRWAPLCVRDGTLFAGANVENSSYGPRAAPSSPRCRRS